MIDLADQATGIHLRPNPVHGSEASGPPTSFTQTFLYQMHAFSTDADGYGSCVVAWHPRDQMALRRQPDAGSLESPVPSGAVCVARHHLCVKKVV